jgi:hypothetical protein
MKKSFSKYYFKENISDNDNVDEIFNFLFNQPVKYKILNKNIYNGNKIYDNGFDTAVNSTIILKFYLKYLKNHKKTTSIFHIPKNIDYKVYDKLNDILKFGQNCKMDASTKYFHMGYIITLFCGLLYETYINDKILRYASLHDEINNLIVPDSCENYIKLFDEVLFNKNGNIRKAIFYAGTVPFIGTLENYVNEI